MAWRGQLLVKTAIYSHPYIRGFRPSMPAYVCQKNGNHNGNNLAKGCSEEVANSTNKSSLALVERLCYQGRKESVVTKNRNVDLVIARVLKSRLIDPNSSLRCFPNSLALVESLPMSCTTNLEFSSVRETLSYHRLHHVLSCVAQLAPVGSPYALLANIPPSNRTLPSH